MSAFGHAMLDQVNHPDRDIHFHFSIVGGTAVTCSCKDFLVVREEEKRLIGQCLEGRTSPRILDIGCGIGRHSHLARTICPDAEITIVDHDRELQDYAAEAVGSAYEYDHLADIPADMRFDLIFLLGNGLGIFGAEHETKGGLARIREMLTPGGAALIEAGTFKQHRFLTITHELKYGDLVDGPFQWGYASRDWFDQAVAETGLKLTSAARSTIPGGFFIAHVERLSTGI